MCVLVAQSCPTLCDPIDCNPPGFSVHGVFQAQILEWVAVPSSKRSSQPRDRTRVLKSCSFTIMTIQLHVVCGCVCQMHTRIFYVKIVFFSLFWDNTIHTHIQTCISATRKIKINTQNLELYRPYSRNSKQ